MPPEGFSLDQKDQPPAQSSSAATTPVPQADSRYKAPPSGFELAPMPGAPIQKEIPKVPEGVLSATQVAKSAYEHLIPSAIKTGKELVYPFMHPQ